MLFRSHFISSAVESLELGTLQGWLKLAWILIAFSKGIIDVNILGGILKFLKELLTNGGRILLLSAIIILKSVIGRASNNTIPIRHFNILVFIVEVVVSNTVANDPTLEVRNIGATTFLSTISDVPIESFNQARDIDASI